MCRTMVSSCRLPAVVDMLIQCLRSVTLGRQIRAMCTVMVSYLSWYVLQTATAATAYNACD